MDKQQQKFAILMFAHHNTANVQSKTKLIFMLILTLAQVLIIYLKINIDGEECYISEDDSESHCLMKTGSDFPNFLFPGYSCTFGSSSDVCAFGPK